MDGIDLLGHIDRLKESFLWAAAKGGRLEECASLADLGADLNWTSPEGDTALLAAARNGHTEVVSFLLAHGSSVYCSMPGSLETPLHLACKRGQEDLAMVLVDAGASLSTLDGSRKTPIDVAKDRGHEGLARRLQNLGQRADRQNPQPQPSPHGRGAGHVLGTSSSSPPTYNRGGPDSRLPAIRGDARVTAPPRVQRPLFNAPEQGEDAFRGGQVAEAFELSSDNDSAAEGRSVAEDDSEVFNDSNRDVDRIESSEQSQMGVGSHALDRPLHPYHRNSSSSAHRSRKARRDRNARGAPDSHASRSSSKDSFELISDVQKLDVSDQISTLRKELKKALQERDVAQARAEAVKEQSSKMWNELMAAEQTLRRVRKERDESVASLERLQAKTLHDMTLSAIEALETDLKGFLTETTKQKEKLIKDQLDNKSEQRLCVICQEDEKCVLILPCRHLCLCEPCSQRPELKKCPLCRKEIQQTLHVFS